MGDEANSWIRRAKFSHTVCHRLDSSKLASFNSFDIRLERNPQVKSRPGKASLDLQKSESANNAQIQRNPSRAKQRSASPLPETLLPDTFKEAQSDKKRFLSPHPRRKEPEKGIASKLFNKDAKEIRSSKLNLKPSFSSSPLKQFLKAKKNRKELPWAKYFDHAGGRVTAVEAVDEYVVDLSKLFIGLRFAHGAHSRLYHGAYEDKPVAVKIIRVPDDDENGDLGVQLEKQFNREVTLLSRLHHQNVIRFIAACKEPPVFCIITEYISEGSNSPIERKSENRERKKLRSSTMVTYNLCVRLLDGKTLNLRLPTPSITGESIKRRLYSATAIPTDLQLLVADGRDLSPETLIFASIGTPLFPTVHLLLPLAGGKGGFGSLLRGAATKAGQKKTNNFDACRDMSGRRLRHVNAEKRLEEWQAEAEDRRLEKIAEEFLKKKGKTGKRAVDGVAEKYVEKYREESAKCVEVMEASVREAFEVYKNSKRKGSAAAPISQSKKLKIWMGKQKLEYSDSEDMDEGDSDDDQEEVEIEKSVVLDGGNLIDSSKETEKSSSSASCGKEAGECSAGGSCESGSEEEKETMVHENSECCEIPGRIEAHEEVNMGTVVVSGTEAVQLGTSGSHEPKSGQGEDSQPKGPKSSSFSGAAQEFEPEAVPAKENRISASQSGVDGGMMLTSKENSDAKKPLNFYEFNSATEMEAFGMERLKSELQARGLKCGGTLKERAARLFLLKTTPLEMLPKKLLAKK